MARSVVQQSAEAHHLVLFTPTILAFGCGAVAVLGTLLLEPRSRNRFAGALIAAVAMLYAIELVLAFVPMQSNEPSWTIDRASDRNRENLRKMAHAAGVEI